MTGGIGLTSSSGQFVLCQISANEIYTEARLLLSALCASQVRQFIQVQRLVCESVGKADLLSNQIIR